jgi:uncharacterized protein (DUF1810 family)
MSAGSNRVRQMDDPFDLERFVAAQDAHGTYQRVLGELRNGRKTTHWMWFVFPQIVGLGQSAMSRTYAISSLGEASAYHRHRVLGPRLTECTGIVVAHGDRSAEQIFGVIDARKLQSSMTLFWRAVPDEPVFGRALDRFFHGTPDSATDAILAVNS